MGQRFPRDSRQQFAELGGDLFVAQRFHKPEFLRQQELRVRKLKQLPYYNIPCRRPRDPSHEHVGLVDDGVEAQDVVAPRHGVVLLPGLFGAGRSRRPFALAENHVARILLAPEGTVEIQFDPVHRPERKVLDRMNLRRHKRSM